MGRVRGFQYQVEKNTSVTKPDCVVIVHQQDFVIAFTFIDEKATLTDGQTDPRSQ